jgi:hypothetical protein
MAQSLAERGNTPSLSSWSPPTPDANDEAIFLSYRHDDDRFFAQALYQKLALEFPRGTVFMDVAGGIRAGDDIRNVIKDRLAKCVVLLVIVGKKWLDARDAQGCRRLDDVNDLVRVEIELALRAKKQVIPVLVNDATMSAIDVLPDELKPLSYRRAAIVRHERFDADCEALQGELSALLKNLRERVDPSALPTDQAQEMGAQIEQLRAVIDQLRRQQWRLRIVATAVVLVCLPLAIFGYQDFLDRSRGLLDRVRGLLQARR